MSGNMIMKNPTVFSNLARFIAIMAFLILGVSSFSSKSLAEQCNRFDPPPSPLSLQWAPCSNATAVTASTSNFSSIGGASDYYLKVEDQSGPSQVCTTASNPLLGDWTKLNCGELCFDAQAFDSTPNVPPRRMWVKLTGGGGKQFTFLFANPADTLTVDQKWHKFCVPLGVIASGAVLPSNSHATWLPVTGTLPSDWNTMLANVTEVRLPVDFSASPTEVTGYDNICLTPGQCVGQPTVIKTFNKTAELDCDKITYKIWGTIESDGSKPDTIHISDLWPTGVIPGTTIAVAQTTPTLPVSTAVNTTGWDVKFTTPAVSNGGPVTTQFSISFTVKIDPAALNSGQFDIKNQATLTSLFAQPMAVKSDDPKLSGKDDATAVHVDPAKVKECLNTHTDGGTPNCLKATPDVSCGPTKGTYTITLHPQGVNGVIPSVLQVSTTTPGISLVPANASILVTGGVAHVTVVGATPGQAISLDVAGTAIGQGSSQGIDQCCNGKVEIVIPKDLDCDKDKVDIAIHKDGATSPPRDVPWYSFDLKMTNEGKAFTAAPGQLTVTEHVPAGMKFTAITPSAGWTCLPVAPVTGPANLVCTYAGGPVAAGPNATIGTIKITAQNLNPAPYADVENCADIGLAAGGSAVETNLGNNKSCVIVSKKPPVIKVEKTCDPAIKGPGDLVAPKWEAACHIKITTTGSVSGPLNISEVFGPAGTVSYTGSSTSDPWTCAPVTATAPTPMNCTLPGNTLNPVSDVTIIDVKVVFPTMGAITESKNCATPKYAGQVGKKSCVPFTRDDSTIHVTKTCDPASWHKYPVSAVATGIGFVSNCHITVTTTGPQTGTVSVNDVLSGTGTLVSMSSTSAPAWNCTSPSCSINGGSLNQTSSTSTFNATVVFATSGNALEAKNCAKLAVNQVDAGKSCVNFTVDEVKPKLEIVKTGLKDCQAGVPCPFTISITSIGQPYSGNILLSDVLTPNLAWPVTSITPNICGGAITTMPFNCVANVNLAANTPLTFTVTLNPLTTNALSQNENCISAAFVGSAVPVGPMSMADVQALASSNQLSTPVRSCWKFTEPPQGGDSSIKINKVCDPAVEIIGAINRFESKCHITVTTTGAQAGTINVNDALTGVGTLTSISAPPPWTCTSPNCSVNGNQLNQTSSTSVIEATVSFPDKGSVSETNNCAKLLVNQTQVDKSCVTFKTDVKPPSDLFKLTLTKICDSYTELQSGGPWVGQCHVTITATGGPRPAIIQLHETLTDSNTTRSPPVATTAFQSTDPWSCTPAIGSGVPANTPIDCGILGSSFPASGTSTLNFSVYIPKGTLNGEAQNCAIAAGLSSPNVETVPASRSANVCVPLPGGAKEPVGQLTIIKDAQYNGQHITNQSFNMNVTCGGKQQQVSVTDGTPYVQTGIPVGTDCDIAEILAAGTSLCPKGQTGTWATTYAPNEGVTIPASGATVTVTNKLVCEDIQPAGDGVLYVKKIVINNAPGSVKGLQFEVHDLCPTVGQPSGSIHLLDGEIAPLKNFDPSLVTVFPPLATCQVAEGAMPFTNACGNLTPKWTVGYSSPSTVAENQTGIGINGPGMVFAHWLPNTTLTVTITNTLDCVTPPIAKTAEPILTPPIVVKPPVDTSPKCDAATATPAGELCRCRFSNMSPVSKTECQCNKGFKLDAGQGCVKIVVRPVCKPPQVYNPATNTCITPRPVCRDPQVYDANSNRCITPRPVCRQPQVYNPATNSCITPRPICKKPQVYDANSNRCVTPRPVCRPPQIYNPATNRCINVRPVCQPGTQYNPKRNSCVQLEQRCPAGTIKARGQCIEIPRCRFPQIPVPGTGICVNPFGGGDRPPQKPDGGAVPGL